MKESYLNEEDHYSFNCIMTLLANTVYEPILNRDDVYKAYKRLQNLQDKFTVDEEIEC